MRCKFLLRARSLFAGLLIAGLPAESALMSFTDRTAFEAATTGRTEIDFEGIVPTESAEDFGNPEGLKRGGITFRTSGTGPLGSGFVSVYGSGRAQQSPVFNTGTGALLAWGPPGQPGTAFLDILLPPGITAFATDFFAQQPFVTTAKMIVNSGEATENFEIVTSDRPAHSFFGVTSDFNTILLVRIGIPEGQAGLILDNVSIGRVGNGSDSVPEPVTMLLVCAGLASITILRRRQQTRVP